MEKQSNILIVDDIPANMFALEEILQKPGRNILHAANGSEALSLLLNSEVDLIMMDVHMPDMDGFEVAQLLKSRKATANIPVIFVTAEKTGHHFMMKGFAEGAIDYLFKPLDPEITEAKVSVLLQLQLQKKELAEKNRDLAKQALLISNSADMIFVIDPKTLEFKEVNNAVTTILGYTKDEVNGTPVSKYLSEESVDLIKELGQSDEEKLSFETEAYDKSGNLLWLQWNVISKNGRWYTNVRDITTIKLYEEQLEQQTRELKAVNQELESFSYSVSHDLRAPLRAIGGFALMLEKKCAELINEEGHRLIGIIRSNVVNMGQLIDDLLSFSRIGRTKLNVAENDFNQLVHHAITELTQEDRSVAGRIQIKELLPSNCDYNMMKLVFQNLLSNAIKYSSKEKHPKIIVGSKKDKTGQVYYISDNGVGFNMEYAEQLFQVFQRLHDANEFEGTGVGLALVQRIIHRHGGKIWAESKPDKGATFYFSLPEQSSKVKVAAINYE